LRVARSGLARRVRAGVLRATGSLALGPCALAPAVGPAVLGFRTLSRVHVRARLRAVAAAMRDVRAVRYFKARVFIGLGFDLGLLFRVRVGLCLRVCVSLGLCVSIGLRLRVGVSLRLGLCVSIGLG